MTASFFHDDELTAQRLAGGGPIGVGIRSFMPAQHRALFALLPYLFVATTDRDGWPLATVLTGRPGFVAATDATHIEIGALPAPDDPAAPNFDRGQHCGVLGLDLTTRRRNRANGTIVDRAANGFALRVQQSFDNCPKYIRRRSVEPMPRVPQAVQTLAALDTDSRSLIAMADTFFVASRARNAVGTRGGMDISHRGGKPGFVRVDGDRLSIPDFRGNRYYNTLGNLLGEPRASLLFLDFERGDIVQLQGTVDIDWDAGADVIGAERMWHFQIMRGWRRRSALPLRWRCIDSDSAPGGSGSPRALTSATGPVAE